MNNNQTYLIQPWIRSFIGTPRPNRLKVLREKATWRTDSIYTWEQLSDILNFTTDKLKELNPKLAHIKEVREGTVIVYPGKALGVSYTEEGLKYICNNRGDMLYYKNVLFKDLDSIPKDEPISNKVLVEDFIPHDHITRKYGKEHLNIGFQISEIMVTDKALRMYYVPTEETNQLVYTSRSASMEEVQS